MQNAQFFTDMINRPNFAAKSKYEAGGFEKGTGNNGGIDSSDFETYLNREVDSEKIEKSRESKADSSPRLENKNGEHKNKTDRNEDESKQKSGTGEVQKGKKEAEKEKIIPFDKQIIDGKEIKKSDVDETGKEEGVEKTKAIKGTKSDKQTEKETAENRLLFPLAVKKTTETEGKKTGKSETEKKEKTLTEDVESAVNTIVSENAAENGEKLKTDKKSDVSTEAALAAAAGEAAAEKAAIENRVKEPAAEKTTVEKTSAENSKPGAAKAEMTFDLREEKKVFIIDKRTAAEGKQKIKIENSGNQKDPNSSAPVKDELFGKIIDSQITQKEAPSAETQGRMKNHAAQLKSHLSETGNKQIVKQTGIILKNDNSGEIKLVLKPDSLGNVRIKLSLQDNSITGKILVDNSAVKNTFDQNMGNLYRAFREAGFENASLDVSVGGEKNQNGGGEKKGGSGFTSGKIKVMEENIPLVGGEKNADTLIDLVV